ncbi:MAG: alpha/beta fold hydrolase [Candidatus Parvarchaeota archaeon]|nr:alpha/beta fold hydrolase [Candidatus Parvarchaeota archaeon]
METLAEILDIPKNQLKFVETIKKTQIDKPAPKWTTANKIIKNLKTLLLREFTSSETGIPTLIVAPYAGHSSVIVDFKENQSLVEALIKGGAGRVSAIDWKSATSDMKDLTIDNYLSDLNQAVNALGGKVNLVGICQGGWLSAMYAARFKNKVNSLVLAGAPIDTSAGEGAIKFYARNYPIEFFEGMVALGGGLMPGDFVLAGFKSLHAYQSYIGKFVDLYKNINDPAYLEKFETFERWYEYTLNLPGKWYLQVITELFKENKFFNGRFVGLGKRLKLCDINCPVYLLAGESDDITPVKQVFNAEKYLGSRNIVKNTVAGGHIGLFMGSKTIKETWPEITKWIMANTK